MVAVVSVSRRFASVFPLLTLMFVMAAQANAAFLTISGTGTFDTSLGTLESVEITLAPLTFTTTASGAHSHTADPGANRALGPAGLLAPGTRIDFLPFSPFTAGSHGHSFVLPTLTFNGIDVQLSGFLTAFSSHSHTIDFGPVTVASNRTYNLPLTATSSGGGHTHQVSIGALSVASSSADTLDRYSTGNGLASLLDVPAVASSISQAHRHFSPSGSRPALINGILGEVELPSFYTSYAGEHNHVIDVPAFGVASTTFTYTPHAVPEPASILLCLTAIPGMMIARHRRRPSNEVDRAL